MKKTTIGLTLLAGALVFNACKKNNNNNSNGFNAADQNFMVLAANSNYAEIQLGQMAAGKGTSPAVKAFGQMMVMEHTQSGVSLDSIAKSGSVLLAPALDTMHVTLQQQLGTLTGKAFDSVYINTQIKDHQKTDSLFGAEQNNANADNRLKGFVNQYRPHVQMHLMMADSIATHL